ncbi:MAG: 3-oxoacyl-[acyl-carrier-protein] reductase [Coriobacteriia bacterium]|nr:3-oxoacyl-[acyl-carrier-protein] reductase [Coriobacteriia bacterium]
MSLLEEKVILVTGGSRGIGRATVLEAAAQGADVAIIYRANTAEAEQVAAEVTALGVSARTYACDVAEAEQVKALIEQVIADFGQLDIVVNNAGIARDKLLIAMSEEDFDAVIATNLKGAFNVAKAAASKMIRKRTGVIINISSIVGQHGNAGQANYAAAKAGLIGMTQSIAKELAGRNVRCCAVAPGFIETDMTAGLSEQLQEKMLAEIPLARLGQPEDIARAVVWLASDQAAYITGITLTVDGGMTI